MPPDDDAGLDPLSADLALARRVVAGDEAAFRELFDDCFPRLFRFVLLRLHGDEDAAEEIAQRVLVRAMRSLHTYRGEAALLTWLFTFCRREVAHWQQRRGRRAEVSVFDLGVEARAALEARAAEADDPEAALRRRELSALIQTALDHLPGRYGDVLEWKYMQELSVEEIAGRLGVGYKAAESLLARARAAFREGFLLTPSHWPPEARSRPRAAEGS